MNLPNKITLARIFGIAVFLFFLAVPIVPYHQYLAAITFALLALTDTIDGIIARKTKQITTFGQFIDPVADKLLVASALIFLTNKGIPAWMTFVILAREFVVTGFRLVAVSKGIVVSASWWGKAKNVSQVVAIVAVILQVPYALWLLGIAVVLTVVSGFEYVWKGKGLFKE